MAGWMHGCMDRQTHTDRNRNEDFLIGLWTDKRSHITHLSKLLNQPAITTWEESSLKYKYCIFWFIYSVLNLV